MTTCLNEDRVYMLSKVGVGGSPVYSQLMVRPPLADKCLYSYPTGDPVVFAFMES